MDEVNLTCDMLQTCCTAYSEYYELAREAYVGFVKFAPSVQQSMLDVEKWQQQFEVRRQQTLDDFDEIERLRTWYQYF
jgi:hypothetical protein